MKHWYPFPTFKKDIAYSHPPVGLLVVALAASNTPTVATFGWPPLPSLSNETSLPVHECELETPEDRRVRLRSVCDLQVYAHRIAAVQRPLQLNISIGRQCVKMGRNRGRTNLKHNPNE